MVTLYLAQQTKLFFFGRLDTSYQILKKKNGKQKIMIISVCLFPTECNSFNDLYSRILRKQRTVDLSSDGNVPYNNHLLHQS